MGDDASWWLYLKKGLEFAIFPTIFCFLIGYSIRRWPAYLTYLFAGENFSGTMYCAEKDVYGKKSREFVILRLGLDDKEYLSLPWPNRSALDCPGDVNVTARKWFLGFYFTDVK